MMTKPASTQRKALPPHYAQPVVMGFPVQTVGHMDSTIVQNSLYLGRSDRLLPQSQDAVRGTMEGGWISAMFWREPDSNGTAFAAVARRTQ